MHHSINKLYFKKVNNKLITINLEIRLKKPTIYLSMQTRLYLKEHTL